MKRARIQFLLVTFLFLLAGCNSSGRSDLPVPPAGILVSREQIALGEQLFMAHCAECHGSIAEGRTQRAVRLKPAAPDFKEHRYRTALPGYLYLRIAQGRNLEPFRSAGSVMPAWNVHLKEKQIWSLVAYIRNRAGSIAVN
jgi:mono/diheme cytochrome c family protein